MTTLAERSSLRLLAGSCALLAGVVAVVSAGLSAAAMGTDVTALAAPERLLASGPRSAEFLRWAMLADVFGYYLLLAPAALYLHDRLKDHDPPRMALYTLGGFGYMLIGSMGAAMLGAVLPPLIRLA